jgi:hypothetical protein
MIMKGITTIYVYNLRYNGVCNFIQELAYASSSIFLYNPREIIWVCFKRYLHYVNLYEKKEKKQKKKEERCGESMGFIDGLFVI